MHFTDSDDDAIRDAIEPVLASFHYELSADGNKSSATEVDDRDITRTFTWTYDALDRLTSETLVSTDTAQQFITRFTMDLVGNRLKMETDRGATAQAIVNFAASGTLGADVTVTYDYDNNDRLLWEKSDDTDDTKDTYTVYSWTAGDQTGKTVHAGLNEQGAVTEETTFEYSVHGRTAKITIIKSGQMTEITYKYNVDGIRVEESTTANGQTTTKSYLIDASSFTGFAQVLEEFVNGQLAKTFTFGHDVLTQADATNGPLTFLYDGHGSTRALLDTIGVAVQRYAYEAYGVQINGQGLTSLASAITSLLYSGEMTDGLAGLQNLRDRQYDLGTGRFTQSDRYTGSNGDPRSLNKYSYTMGNPVAGTDPSGQVTLVQCIVTGGIIGAVAGLLYGSYVGARKAGTFWSWKTLEYGLIGAGVGFAVGAAVGVAAFYASAALTWLARQAGADATDLLIQAHGTRLKAFGAGVISGVVFGLWDDTSPDRALAAIASADAAAATMYIINAAAFANWEKFPKFMEPYFSEVLRRNAIGRPVTPQGVVRATTMWATWFCTGFLVGYSISRMTKWSTDYVIDFVASTYEDGILQETTAFRNETTPVIYYE